VDFEAFIDNIERWCEEAHGVRPGQNEKVAERLIELGADLHEKTATGKWKLDKNVLLGCDHELATMVYRRRRAQKLASSYLVNFLKDQVNGLVHADVRQLGARTGRMSVTRPALQTLPRGNIVRGSFVPDDESQALLSADYDQIEMRLLAHFSGDPRMIEGIEYGDQMRLAGYNGYDLHSMNARGIYGIPMNEPVPKKQRDVTKNAGFAKAYGAGVERFSLTAGVEVEVGKAFLDQYDHTFPGVRAFQRQIEQVAKERLAHDGRPWAQSPIGRYHPAESGKEYTLTNYLIQGTAADVFKEGLVRLDAAGLGDYIRCLVHDEVIFSVPRDGAEDLRREIERSMDDRQQFRVPLTTECSAPLSRWGEKYDYSEFDAVEMVYSEGEE
jgi:DNA polymerase-1